MQITQDQYYLFTMPDDSMCPVWCETFLTDGTHVVAPMPYTDLRTSGRALRGMHPGAWVDELLAEVDILTCRQWAATMPLEQLPAVTL